MTEWTSFGWILAIAFVIGFVFVARWIFLKIKAHREKDTLV